MSNKSLQRDLLVDKVNENWAIKEQIFLDLQALKVNENSNLDQVKCSYYLQRYWHTIQVSKHQG